MDVVNKCISLYLNSVWFPIEIKPVNKAIADLYSGGYMAVYIDENGEKTPMSWSEWIKLPISDSYFQIRSPNFTINVPTILITKNYSKIKKVSFHLNKKNLRKRDADICQYSGLKLTKETASTDHVIPLSRGGKNEWDNVVLCHKTINSKKGNKTPEECGLKLRRKPFKPSRNILFSDSISEVKHFHWRYFLNS